MVSGIGYFALSLLPLAFLTLIVVLAIRSIWVAITPPRRGVKVPSCEHCKYPVTGLNALACPECGSDLRLTGIITRPMEMRRRGSLATAILWLTTLCMVLWIIVTYAVMMFAAPWAAGAGVGGPGMTMTTPLTPASAAFKSIDVEQTLPGRAGFPPLVLVLHLNDATTRRLEINAGTYLFSSKDDSGAEVASGSFDEKTLPSWLAGAGIDTTDATVIAELTDLERATDVMLASTFGQLGNIRFAKLTAGTMVQRAVPATTPASAWKGWVELIEWLGLFVPIGLWVLGVVVLVWRRRKLMREAWAQMPPPTVP